MYSYKINLQILHTQKKISFIKIKIKKWIKNKTVILHIFSY